MWNDLVTKFNETVANLSDWISNTKALIIAALPVAAFVYFLLFRLRKPPVDKRTQLDQDNPRK